MKNINKLKKEIEELRFYYDEEISEETKEREKEWKENPRNLYFELKAKLKTLREVCEEIKGLREILSDLEHEQWMSWSKYIAENNKIPKELLDKWKENWKPYSKLDEKTKDSDRIWADKIIKELLKKFGESNE